MEYKDVARLETDLVNTLKEEYSFYQTLFILIDKQRDYIKYDKDQKLVKLYDEVERLYSRIQESEQKITTLRSHNRELFSLAASAPEVRRLVNSITTLISRAVKVVRENEESVSAKYVTIKQRLADLQKSSSIGSYLSGGHEQPRFVDKRN